MKFAFIAGALLALCVTPAVYAGTWQVCRLEVQIIKALKLPVRGLEGRVESVKAKPADTECPSKGQIIAFEPESANWQSMLPRKHWPTPGQRVWMRYQYLDGICKGDGHNRPCRIEHYPMGW